MTTLHAELLTLAEVRRFADGMKEDGWMDREESEVGLVYINLLLSLLDEIEDKADEWESIRGLFIKDRNTKAVTVKAFRVCAAELKAIIARGAE